ncbi:MAG: hypothetical protein AB8G18_05620 [Gammaproteobacteria bacterium]
MRRTIITITASLLALSSYADSDTKTPEAGNEKTTITTTSVSEESVDWGRDGKKKVRASIGITSNKLPGKTKSIKSTTQISRIIEIEQPTASALACESDIDLEYYQRDTATEVRTLFTSENCSEFDAKYQLRIMYFDVDGKLQRIVADEQWPIGQTQQVKKLFPLTPNSELQRVSSRILSCTCSEAPQ